MSWTRWIFVAMLTGIAGRLVTPGRVPIHAPGYAPGQLPLHVAYYGLHLRFDPDSALVRGHVTVQVTRPGMQAAPLTLDLASTMVVDSVTVGGRRVTVNRDTLSLTVALPASSEPQASTLVDVTYHGTPAGDALLFTRHGTAPVISSYGLPYSARAWWPSVDAPATKKADSADIEITGPSGLTAASNGRLVATRENGDGTATTLWSVRYPIYPDVIAVAISNYSTFTLPYRGAAGDTLPMVFYVFPEDLDKAHEDFSVLPAMLAHHVARFGAYPFAREKYGVAEMAKPSFREHQTLPGYGPRFITGDHHNDWVLAHELAHQWFGDALTVRTWSDVWLNEGFATYAALLWREQTNGSRDYSAAIRAWMVPEVYDGALYVADSTDVDRMFTRVTFQKGALVLHMLRHVMGDTRFFDALRHYVADNLGRTVTTDDFQHAAERAYGRSLEWFFSEWVRRGGAPRYEISGVTVRRRGTGYRVDLDLSQRQDSGLFTMPLDLSLTTASGSIGVMAWDSARVQHLTLRTRDSVTAVTVDPGGWVVTAR